MKKYAGLLERVLWTAAQAGLGLITVEALDVPTGYAAIAAAVIATIKGFVAKRVGNKDTWATLPASLDK